MALLYLFFTPEKAVFSVVVPRVQLLTACGVKSTSGFTLKKFFRFPLDNAIKILYNKNKPLVGLFYGGKIYETRRKIIAV